MTSLTASLQIEICHADALTGSVSTVGCPSAQRPGVYTHRVAYIAVVCVLPRWLLCGKCEILRLLVANVVRSVRTGLLAFPTTPFPRTVFSGMPLRVAEV